MGRVMPMSFGARFKWGVLALGSHKSPHDRQNPYSVGLITEFCSRTWVWAHHVIFKIPGYRNVFL